MTYTTYARTKSLSEASALDPIRGLVNASVLKELLLERQKEEASKLIRKQSIDVACVIKDMKLKHSEDGVLYAEANLRLSEEMCPEVKKLLAEKGYAVRLESADSSFYSYSISTC